MGLSFSLLIPLPPSNNSKGLQGCCFVLICCIQCLLQLLWIQNGSFLTLIMLYSIYKQVEIFQIISLTTIRISNKLCKVSLLTSPKNRVLIHDPEVVHCGRLPGAVALITLHRSHLHEKAIIVSPEHDTYLRHAAPTKHIPIQ